MKKIIAPKMVLAAIALSLMAFSPAHAETSKRVSGFVEAASIANGYEIKSGQLMLKHTNNDYIRNYAQRIVNDHKLAEQKLRQAASEAGAGAQVFPDSLDAEHNQMMEKLQMASYENLDAEFIKQQMGAHQTAVEIYEDYARFGDNPNLRQYAMDMLPALREHKAMLNELGSHYGMSRDTKYMN